MPVVSVHAPASAAVGELLITLADSISAALGLGAGDVIATHIPTGASAVSGAEAAASVTSWPIVSIHGSDRGREKMDAARAVSETVVRQWCERHAVLFEGVWTQWLTPMPA